MLPLEKHKIAIGQEGRSRSPVSSSHGNNTYVVYRCDDNAYVTTFPVVAGRGVDSVAAIEAVAVGLEPAFPASVLVVQDAKHDGNYHNSKVVPPRTILVQS
jgi:myo-inositol-hexaphosphate 3-phosphohydrolase